MLWPTVWAGVLLGAPLVQAKVLGALKKNPPGPNYKDQRLLTTAAHGMRKHSRKFFWFSLFTKRTVPSCNQ